jgi:hypothetical protein
MAESATNPVPKFQYIGITIPTANINHTAPYKHGETLDNFKSGAFKSQYKTDSRRGKDVESREHDGVISRVIKAMGLMIQFVEVRGSRYANIYAKFRTTDGSEVPCEQLLTIVKKFRRKPEPAHDAVIPIIFSNSDKVKELLGNSV